MSQAEIGAKVGRSREFVSNSIRLLLLPEEIQAAVVDGKLSEGHARALLMLTDRPQERDTLFKEIMLKKTSVRMVEQLVRRIAQDKVRKHDKSPEMMETEKILGEALGTRVIIENRPTGGRVLIEFFTNEDLSHIVDAIANDQPGASISTLDAIAAELPDMETTEDVIPDLNNEVVVPKVATASDVIPVESAVQVSEAEVVTPEESTEVSSAPIEAPISTPTPEPVAEQPVVDEDLYAVRNFTV